MKIFLSYHSSDYTFASDIYNYLIEQELEVFFDQQSLTPGVEWTDRIEDNINNSEAAIILIGQNGVGKWQNKEILKIIATKILSDDTGEITGLSEYLIYPIILPGTKYSNLPWTLAEYQWIEFKERNDEYAFEKLSMSLKHEVEIIANSTTNPYKGLDSFELEDAANFYGRYKDLNQVFNKYLRLQYGINNEFPNGKERNNFVAIVGDSGSGKSSFAKAGILQALKNNRFKDSGDFIQVTIRPGAEPHKNLSAALKNSLITDTRKFEDDFLEHDDELNRNLREQNKVYALLIDQFEEIVTLCTDEIIRSKFIRNLYEAVFADKFILIITLRSDFIAKVSITNEFKALLQSNLYLLNTINAKEEDQRLLLQQIIKAPARRKGIHVENSLVDKLITELKEVADPLPILQFTMYELWDAKPITENTITLELLAKISNNKDLAGVIERHADEVVNQLTRSQSDTKILELLKRIFVPNLIKINENASDTKRTALWTEYPDDPDVHRMLNLLSQGKTRLLKITLWKDASNIEIQNKSVDLIHEVLIKDWTLLKKWIEGRREALNRREYILSDIRFFYKGEREYYNRKELATLNKWLKNNPDLITPEILEFKSKSQSNRNKFFYNSFIASLLFIIILFIGKYLFDPILKRNRLCSDKYLRNQVEKYDDFKNVNILNFKESSNYKIRDISIFKGLKGLNISNTNLESLRMIPNLENISGLVLNQNYLLTSLQGIEKLTSLQSLTIGNNKSLSSLEGVEKLTSLQSLTIVNNYGLTNLQGIEKLTSLQSLTIGNNKSLSSLEGIEKLTSLQSLTIGNNDGLTSLQGIEKLTSLRSLTIGNNNGFNISLQGIEKLTSLQSLIISNDDSLTSLQGIEKLTSFQSLNIESNYGLTSLQGIEKLTSLQSLIISNNDNLTSLEGIEKLTSLQSLIISINDNLTSLQGIEKLTSLQSLTIDNNYRLTSLQGIEELTSLQSLTIDNNYRLTSLQGIEKLTSLQSLTIVNNKSLSSLEGIEKLTSLQSLIIINNDNLTSLQGIEKLTFLQSLTIGNNYGLTSLQGIEKLTSLQSLIISNNDSLTSLQGIEKLTFLQSLTINNNDNLTSLQGIEKLTFLQSLTINNNENLTSLQGIENIKSLRSINLSNDYLIARLIKIKHFFNKITISECELLPGIAEFRTDTLSIYSAKFIATPDFYRKKGFKVLEISSPFVDTVRLKKEMPEVKILFIKGEVEESWMEYR